MLFQDDFTFRTIFWEHFAFSMISQLLHNLGIFFIIMLFSCHVTCIMHWLSLVYFTLLLVNFSACHMFFIDVFFMFYYVLLFKECFSACVLTFYLFISGYVLAGCRHFSVFYIIYLFQGMFWPDVDTPMFKPALSALYTACRPVLERLLILTARGLGLEVRTTR